MFGAIDEVSNVERAIKVLLRPFTMQLTVHFDPVLLGSLACDRFAHGHHYFRLFVLIIIVIIVTHDLIRLGARKCLLVLLLDHREILLSRDLVRLGLERLVWTGTLQLELGAR